MPPTLSGSADANTKIEDLSGVDLSTHSNPYDALITACNNDTVRKLSFNLLSHLAFHMPNPPIVTEFKF